MSENRMGKHKEGKTLFGAYVEPEVKALAEMTSEKLGITFTDIILNGLRSEATRAGIMRNNQIVKECKAEYELLVAMTREKILKSKKSRKSNKKGE